MLHVFVDVGGVVCCCYMVVVVVMFYFLLCVVVFDTYLRLVIVSPLCNKIFALSSVIAVAFCLALPSCRAFALPWPWPLPLPSCRFIKLNI